MIVLERLSAVGFDGNKSYEEIVVEGVARFSGLDVDELVKSPEGVDENTNSVVDVDENNAIDGVNEVSKIIEKNGVEVVDDIGEDRDEDKDGKLEKAIEGGEVESEVENEDDDEVILTEDEDDESEDEEDGKDTSRSSSRSAASSGGSRKSPRKNIATSANKVNETPPQAPVRRSARERKQFRCPVKDCEKNPASKIEEILRHINVNHPTHYASLITKKHDQVKKICAQECFHLLYY